MNELVKSRLGVNDRLRAQGFALFDVELLQGGDLWGAGEDYYMSLDRSRLVADCRHLPEDAGADATYRRRSRFMLLPGRAAPLPFGENWDEEASPDFTHEPHITPLTRAQRESFALHHTICMGHRCADRLGREAPIDVTVEICRSEPRRNAPVPALPDSTSKERPSFRMVVLLSREGVEEGETFVTPPQVAGVDPRFLDASAIRDRFTLLQPWQGCILDSRSASLHLSPVRLSADSEHGHQTRLIIDYTRLTPEKPR